MTYLATTARLLAVLALLAAPAAVLAQTPGEILDTGTVQFEFFDNGELGAYAIENEVSFGEGFVFNGDNGLFEGTFLVGADFDQVSGAAYEFLDFEWSTVSPVTAITPPAGFDQAFEAVYDDSAAPNPIGLEVTARAYARMGEPFVITDFTIVNTSGGSLNNLSIGIFADWDVSVGDPADDLGGYDEDTQLLYTYDPDGDPSANYFGVVVLDAEVSGWNLDTGDGNPDEAALYGAMTNGGGTIPAGLADRRSVIGIGPYDIPASGDINVKFAFIGGTSEADIIANAHALGAPVVAPDLVVAGLAASPPQAPPGAEVTVSFAMRNDGQTASMPSQTNLRLGTSPITVTNQDPLLAEVAVPTIEPDTFEEFIVPVSIPAGLSPGTYYLWAIADVNSTAGQTPDGELNDEVNVPFEVTGVGEPVDVSFFNIPFGPFVNGSAPIAEGTLTSGPPAKISADGSEATRVVLQSDFITAGTIGDLEVDLVGDGGTAALGTLSPPVFEADVDGAEVTYTHPRLVSSTGESSRIHLRVRFEGATLGEYPIDVYRAPVLMVHGLWSDPSVFADMEASFELSDLWPGSLLRRMNYSSTHSGRFSENAGKLRDNLYGFLFGVVEDKFSAGRADVVGHSMGGILARLRLQDTDYVDSRAKVNRLVTLNTPHSGSQAANLIMECLPLRLLLGVTGHPTGEGAVDDLRVDSDAIRDDLNGGALNRNVTPSHALITLADDFGIASGWDIALLVAAIGTDCTEDLYTSPEDLAFVLYQGPSDALVAEESQLGGLSINAAFTTLVEEQIHRGSPSNTDVIGEVFDVLEADPLLNLFTDDGFDPRDLNFIPPAPRKPYDHRGSLDVTITSPGSGTIVAPGETISVAATGSSDVDQLTLGAGNSSILLYAATEEGSSATFSYVVPQEAAGPVTIAVIGVDGAGAFDDDSIHVVVEPTAALDSLTAYPEDVIVSVDGTTGLSLTGHYADGVDRNVTGLPGIAYAVADPGIATVTDAGDIAGVSEGTTSVSVSYRGRTVDVAVLVIPAIMPVGVEPSPEDEAPVNAALLPAYPNPSNHTVTIPFQLPSRQHVVLRVYDLLGREVRVLFDGEVGVGLHEARLDATGLPSGLYLVRMTTDTYREARAIAVIH